MEIDMGEHASILYGTHYPNKIFVGCLPARITAASLGEYFGCFGEVIEAKVVLDDAKKSKRFGFVSFSRATDAKTVLSAGDFYMLGKRIVVGPAVKREFKERVADEAVKIVMAQEAVIEHNPPRRFVYRPLKQEIDDLPIPPQQTPQCPLPANNGSFYYPLFFDPNFGFFYH
eukprot:TCONS_00028222-protein